MSTTASPSTPATEPAATPQRISGYPEIGDYAAIGDGRSLALVARDGSIDWLCLPRQDAPSVFAAIVDAARGGRFSLEPAVPYSVERRYVERTNVLQTDFRTGDGVVRVTDAFTLDLGRQVPWRELVRRVECLGEQGVPMRWRFEPRFDFGRQAAQFSRREDAHVARDGALALALQTWEAGEPSVADGAVDGSFTAGPGAPALLAMTATEGEPLPLPGREALERRLAATGEAWRAWVGRHSYDGRWRESVERSLLALRLLTDPQTGALLAAGTTSLPEVVGKSRNFDYRFGWVCDAAFAMDALMRFGMEQTGYSALTWLLEAEGRTHPRLNPVYHLDGSPLKGQHKLPLAGYRASQPVHVGNQAGSQRQLGSWGDFTDTVYLYATHGHLLSPEIGERLADCADLVSRIWRRDDAGLWEISDADYTTSKMSCWTVFDRVLALAEDGQVPQRHTARWREAREEIHRYVETRMWSPEKGSYVMKSGSDMLDCGTLLASRRGFCDPQGERINGTIDAIRSELGAGGPLLYRYSGMQDKEHAFLACSFWMVEALARAQRIDEAAETMDALVGLATDVGLYSEEMDASEQLMRGNFPQALTHLSLLNAAAIFEEASGGSR
jgi:GH15 family glucan-1,4-alpha-glucosidase